MSTHSERKKKNNKNEKNKEKVKKPLQKEWPQAKE
jgi:hypothetical protein